MTQAHLPRGFFTTTAFFTRARDRTDESSLRKVELETGKVVQKLDLPREDFGEGIAMIGDKIYMLTWQQGLGRVLDAKTFKVLKEFNYQGEGWGMTTDGSDAVYVTGHASYQGHGRRDIQSGSERFP